MRRTRRSVRRKVAPRLPRLEPLEDRYVLSLLSPLAAPQLPVSPALVSLLEQPITTVTAAPSTGAAALASPAVTTPAVSPISAPTSLTNSVSSLLAAPTSSPSSPLPTILNVAATAGVSTPSVPIVGNVQLGAALDVGVGGSQMATAQVNASAVTTSTGPVLDLNAQTGAGGISLLSLTTNVGLGTTPPASSSPTSPTGSGVQLGVGLDVALGGGQLLAVQPGTTASVGDTGLGLDLTTQAGSSGGSILTVDAGAGTGTGASVAVDGGTLALGAGQGSGVIGTLDITQGGFGTPSAGLLVAPPSATEQVPVFVSPSVGPSAASVPAQASLTPAVPLPVSAGPNAELTSIVVPSGEINPIAPVLLPDPAGGVPTVGLIGDLRDDLGGQPAAVETVPGPADVDVEIGPAAAHPLLAPDSAGELTGASLLDLSELDALLQQTLDGLSGLSQGLQGLLARLGPWPWICLGVATAAAGCELVRRRQEQVLLQLAATAGQVRPSWLPDLEQ
jgi:hypothetical protein